ncbi:cytochrome c-550 PedF [Terasakiella sp. SH-1]|uniref:cytochrome c-550 PedF n=1 Tax=Terasakiella sp. SH-1 TaxID=2560057 RepID=UPI001073C294|nr:cytochrome c-550 PedF [Terasakiella sp. SH-1]
MLKKFLMAGLVAGTTFAFAGQALAHGDVTPQAVDTSGLPKLGEEWEETNPFREDGKYKARAVEIGSSAYNQNCARCHGLQAISGGIAPDLRYLEADYEGDEWFIERVTNGAVRDGKVYMPKFVGTISQEGLWAIRTYIDEQPED